MSARSLTPLKASNCSDRSAWRVRDLRGGSGAHSVAAPLEVVDADVLQREQVLQFAHLRLQHLRAHENLLNDAYPTETQERR